MQPSSRGYPRGVSPAASARRGSAPGRRYWHAFTAESGGLICTLIAGDTPDSKPRSGPFLAPFPFSGDPVEREWEHVGTWDHDPGAEELNVAKAEHGFSVDDGPPEAA